MVSIELAYDKYKHCIEEKKCLDSCREININGEDFFIEVENQVSRVSCFMNRIHRIASLNSAHMPISDYGMYKGKGIILIKKKDSSLNLDKFCKEKISSNYQKNALIYQLISFIGEMHSKNICHGGINEKNIFVYDDSYCDVLYFVKTKEEKNKKKKYNSYQFLDIFVSKKKKDIYALGELLSKILVNFNCTIKDPVKYLQEMKIDKNSSLDEFFMKDVFLEYSSILKRKKIKKNQVLNMKKSIEEYYIQKLTNDEVKEIVINNYNDQKIRDSFFYTVNEVNSEGSKILEFDLEKRSEKRVFDIKMKVAAMDRYENDLYFVTQSNYITSSKIYRWNTNVQEIELFLQGENEISSLCVQKNNIFYGSRKLLLSDYRDCLSRYNMDHMLQISEMENENIMSIATYGRFIVYGGWFSGGKFTNLDPVNVYPLRLFDMYKGKICDILRERFPIKAIVTDKKDIYYAVSRVVNDKSYNSIIKIDITSRNRVLVYDTKWQINTFIKIDDGFVIAENLKNMYRIVEYLDNKVNVIKKGAGKVLGLA